MYTEEDRLALLDRVLTFVKENQEFVCLVQIGSGAEGFADIYSDIDLMAGCRNVESVKTAGDKLCAFFEELGAVYVDHRQWSPTVLGRSVYLGNGLSVDLSFMPAAEIPIMSKQWRMLWSSDDGLEAALMQKTRELAPDDGLNHHRFFFTLRKAEIAILRRNYFYAEIALSDARQMILRMEAMAEGKKNHEFKAYHTLDKDFLSALHGTYPGELSRDELTGAKDALLSLYVHTVKRNGLPEIEPCQFRIINCFGMEASLRSSPDRGTEI